MFENVFFDELQISNEIDRIVQFIDKQLVGCNKVVIGISGGLDCDVVARLAARVSSIKELKLFTVIQDDMEKSHLDNARTLASDLNRELIEIPLQSIPFLIMDSVCSVDKNEGFSQKGLDGMRMKCNIRTTLYSLYQDHGYVVLGTTNKTEDYMGFFLPFGDGMAHIKPIIHLYKSQVRQIGQALGTRKEVLEQVPSAGFWKGERDLEDMAWWLYNRGPITCELETSIEEDNFVEKIEKQLSVEKIDMVLWGISHMFSDKDIESETGIPKYILSMFRELLEKSKRFKHRPINISLVI